MKPPIEAFDPDGEVLAAFEQETGVKLDERAGQQQILGEFSMLSVRKRSWPLKENGKFIPCKHSVPAPDPETGATIECGIAACGFDANGSPRCKDHGGMIQRPDPPETD